MPTSLFPLGLCVITPSARDTLHPDDVPKALARHGEGDWGDVCQEDWKHNEEALDHQGRLFSVYHDRNKVKFYVISEWDRSATTVLLPEDY